MCKQASSLLAQKVKGIPLNKGERAYNHAVILSPMQLAEIDWSSKPKTIKHIHTQKKTKHMNKDKHLHCWKNKDNKDKIK